jgi:hypothetical protein
MSNSKKKTVASTSPAVPANDLETAVTQAIGQLSAIEASLGTAPPITAADKRRSTKMRKGGEAIAATIGALAQQHQAELPSIQVAPMMVALAKVETLQPLVTSVTSFAQRLDDSVFSAQSAAWTIALELYATLQRMAATSGALASALAPVTDFMAYRHPTPREPGQPTKPQQRALKKSVAKVKKLAPQLLVDDQQAGAPEVTASPTPATASASNGAPQHS